MDVRNCRSCGKLFNYSGPPPLCPACAKELDKKFEEVKEYIYNNRGVNIQVVADENDVSVAQIKKWVREERLSFSDDSSIGLDCEKCGASIQTGRFCKSCKDSLSNQLEHAFEKPKPVSESTPKFAKDKEKMRFLDK